MKHLSPLPEYLLKRYHGWKATSYEENSAWFERLASEGQRPRAMVISCCDSRVHATSFFGADQGEFFMHRNIANLVPPCEDVSSYHGTSAAIEYAVTALNVAHLLVVGHSKCGGVKGCVDMCKGDAPELENTFVGRWMEILKPSFSQVADIEDPQEQVDRMERIGVLTSMTNLMTFPFVAERVESGKLSLHGLWIDIGAGVLEAYDSDAGDFKPV